MTLFCRPKVSARTKTGRKNRNLHVPTLHSSFNEHKRVISCDSKKWSYTASHPPRPWQRTARSTAWIIPAPALTASVMLNSELQHPPKHKPSRSPQQLLTNLRLFAQKTKNLEHYQCLGSELCPSLGRGTTVKQVAVIPGNVTRGNKHQPGAWGASHSPQKHLCARPVSPFPAVANSRCFRARWKNKQTQRPSYAWKGDINKQTKPQQTNKTTNPTLSCPWKSSLK